MTAGTHIEAVRLQPTDPDDIAMTRPEVFDHRYILPQHCLKFLETQNPHVRDVLINCCKNPHIYSVYGLPVHESVSGLTKEFKSDFKPKEPIAAMNRSRRCAWPRLQYVLNARQVHQVTALDGRACGCMIIHKETGMALASTNPGVDAANIIMLKMLREHAISWIRKDEEEWCGFDRVLSDEEICHKWELNSEDARNRSTEVKCQMELWFNSKPVRTDEADVQVNLQCIEHSIDPIGAKAVRTAWACFGEEENVAGCIDLAVILPDSRLYLIDWKRSHKLRSQMCNDYNRMKAPLNHLDDCSGCTYAIQLSCCQYLIEKYDGFKVAGCALVSLHPNDLFVTVIPYLGDEVRFIMRRCRAFTTARLCLSKCLASAELKRTTSGLVVTEAVRDAKNNLYAGKWQSCKRSMSRPTK